VTFASLRLGFGDGDGDGDGHGHGHGHGHVAWRPLLNLVGLWQNMQDVSTLGGDVVRAKILLTTVLSLLLLGSCNGGTTITPDGDGVGGVDTTPDVGDVSVGVDSDVGEGVDLDLDQVDPMDLVMDIEPLCEPGTGCFLDPCSENTDCLSGWCVTHLGTGVCTQTCQEDCPAGWSCQQVAGTDPDVVFVCISDFATLCVPCAGASDCGDVGGPQAACVVYGESEGAFCGGGCDGDDDCPDGFRCEEMSTTEGAALTQCVPSDGECVCTARSIELGLGTPCVVTGEEGTCAGNRVCLEDGLSACDAPMPIAEQCNGADDDCDGQIDEETCDDGNPCTEDACLGEAGCEHVALEGGECADGNPCTAADHCVAGVCVGDPVLCDDQNPCTDDSCTETGGCDHLPNVADCDDGDPCTVADECGDGACAGTAVACDCAADADCLALEDGDLCNGTLVCDLGGLPFQCVVDVETLIECPAPEGIDAPCLVPTCDGETGACDFMPGTDGVPCDDGDPCTVADTCLEGACAPGATANCNDGNPCTDDACDAGVGCTHVPNTEPCEDGTVCTVGDACMAGICVGGDDLACDDGNVCTDDSCDPSSGCVYTPNVLACDDGNACTTQDTCSNGVCAPGAAVDCDDMDVCTDDACAPAVGCLNTVNTAPCDDGDACTIGDSCLEGTCGGSLVVCDDANPCTDDSCDGVSGCLFVPNEAPCDDANACTEGDTCGAGSCAPGAGIDCDDGEVCTTDSCDPLVGCVQAANTQPCDDADACTAGDLCGDGTCAGAAIVCDDGNPCTDDTCDSDGGCTFTPNDAACDDQNACTAGDVCAEGACTPGSAFPCNDGEVCTDDSCDPQTGCVFSVNAAPCDDGDVCTTGDACELGACVPGASITCDDGNPCTDDSCSPTAGCIYDPNADPCDDGNTCTTGDVCEMGLCLGLGSKDCDDGNPCTKDICEPGGGCSNLPVSGACDDDDPCTVNDICAAGACVSGAVKDCDDGNPCTDDLCDLDGTCLHTSNAAACDDGNACTTGDQCVDGACVFAEVVICDDGEICSTDYCSPITGCEILANTLPCDDGDACTTGDVCGGGTCGGVGVLPCDDGNPCTSDTCDPVTGCVFTDNDDGCDDGNACTTVDVCESGTCNGYVAPDCDDADVCTTDSCDPVVGCIHVHNTAPCNDLDACTTVDVCANGTCVGSSPLPCDDGDPCTSNSCDPDTGCAYPTIFPCCGNLVVEAPEQCDDGNQSGGDGCSASCQVEISDCQGGATKLSTSPGADMVVCSNPNTCEQDYETLCPSGWLLCGPKQFNARNAGWSFSVGSKKGLGAIRCRSGGGAGHYTIDNSPLSNDEANNCWYGSSRPSCTSGYGCNEKGNYAVCCKMNDSCGNGVVDHAEEECDDGNSNNTDSCLENCMTRFGGC
jgi:cysteine-rich repeat protein